MKRHPILRMILLGWISALLVGPAAAGGVSYTYDSAGRLIKADYGQGRTITYSYSNSGSLIERRTTGVTTNAPQGTLLRIAERGKDTTERTVLDRQVGRDRSAVAQPREGRAQSDRPQDLRRSTDASRHGDLLQVAYRDRRPSPDGAVSHTAEDGAGIE